MATREELVVDIRANVADARAGLLSFADTLRQTETVAVATNRAAANASTGITRVGTATSRSNQIVTEFGRVLSDIPYGLTAISNNLSQLASVLGVGGAWGIALQAGIAALVIFRNEIAQAFETAQDRANALADSVRKVTDELTIFQGSQQNLDVSITAETVDAVFQQLQAAIRVEQQLREANARAGAATLRGGVGSVLFGNQDERRAFEASRAALEAQQRRVATLRGEYQALYAQQREDETRRARSARLAALPGATLVADQREAARLERERLRDAETASNRQQRRDETAAQQRIRLARTAAELEAELARDLAAIQNTPSSAFEKGKETVGLLERARDAYRDLNPGQGGTAEGLAAINRQLNEARYAFEQLDPEILSGRRALQGLADDDAYGRIRDGLVITSEGMGVLVERTREAREETERFLKVQETLAKKDYSRDVIGSDQDRKRPAFNLRGAALEGLGEGVRSFADSVGRLVSLQEGLGSFFKSFGRGLQGIVADLTAALAKLALFRLILGALGGPTTGAGSFFAQAVGLGKTGSAVGGGFLQTSVRGDGMIYVGIPASQILQSQRIGLMQEQSTGLTGAF